MPELSDIRVVHEILSRHGFRFSKSVVSAAYMRGVISVMPAMDRKESCRATLLHE